jgi:hypothetical protein
MFLNQRFQRPLAQSDLERYLFYGKKMKSLLALEIQNWKDQNDLSLIHPTVFRAIATFIDVHHPGLTVLPKLRRVCCFDSGKDLFWEVISYLSPNIQVFQLHGLSELSQPSPSALALLSATITKSPSIRELRIHYSGMRNAIPFAFPHGLSHLSTFQFSEIPLSCDTIGYLACLPNLHDVSLYYPDRNVGSLSTLSMPSAPFPSLQTLNLHCESFGSGMEFVHTYLVSARLSSVDISASGVPSVGQTRQLFSALSSYLHGQSMTSLRVSAGNLGLVGPALQPRDLEPLLQFSNLESLHIGIKCDPEYLSLGQSSRCNDHRMASTHSI